MKNQENNPIKNNNPNIYILLLTLLCFTLILSVNYFKKVTHCALVMVCLVTILHTIVAMRGYQSAMVRVCLCTGMNMILLHDKPYFIYGKKMPHLIMASLSSILIASFISSKIFTKLRVHYTFLPSNLLSLWSHACLDCTIMASYFLNIFPSTKVLTIFCKEISYKCIFAVVLHLGLYTIKYMKHTYILRNKLRWKKIWQLMP